MMSVDVIDDERRVESEGKQGIRRDLREGALPVRKFIRHGRADQGEQIARQVDGTDLLAQTNGFVREANQQTCHQQNERQRGVEIDVAEDASALSRIAAVAADLVGK